MYGFISKDLNASTVLFMFFCNCSSESAKTTTLLCPLINLTSLLTSTKSVIISSVASAKVLFCLSKLIDLCNLLFLSLKSFKCLSFGSKKHI